MEQLDTLTLFGQLLTFFLFLTVLYTCDIGINYLRIRYRWGKWAYYGALVGALLAISLVWGSLFSAQASTANLKFIAGGIVLMLVLNYKHDIDLWAKRKALIDRSKAGPNEGDEIARILKELREKKG
jgi:hypothetical protein